MGTGQLTANRRKILRNGLVLVAGAFGLGASSAAAAIGKGSGVQAGQTLRLYGRNVHLTVPGQRFGHRPGAGDRATVHGELLDGAGGSKVGEFHASWQQATSPFGDSAFPPGSLEQHTFRLAEGTLFGIGTAEGGSGTFAVVGGTGRYSGARGSYTAVQRPKGLGGDGTAEFILTLSA